MEPLQEIGLLLLQTLGSFYLIIIVLRFLLQVSRADFYNPISQFAIKATNPLLIPLRRIIPGVFGIDMASILLAFITHYLVIQLSALLLGAGLINPLSVAAWSLIGLLSLTINLFFWGLIIMVVFSWIAPQSRHPALMLLMQILEPLLAPLRKLIPPMGGMDFTPIFAFLALNILQILVKSLAASAGIGANLSTIIIGL